MAAVFIDPRSLAVGAEYENLRGKAHVADFVQCCLTL